jgi:hypothetical protein
MVAGMLPIGNTLGWLVVPIRGGGNPVLCLLALCPVRESLLPNPQRAHPVRGQLGPPVPREHALVVVGTHAVNRL